MSLFSKFSSLFPTCREVSRLQSELLDRELSGRQSFGLKFHLLYCRWCRRYGAQLRHLHQAAREQAEQLTGAASQNLSTDARERIKQKLRADAG